MLETFVLPNDQHAKQERAFRTPEPIIADLGKVWDLVITLQARHDLKDAAHSIGQSLYSLSILLGTRLNHHTTEPTYQQFTEFVHKSPRKHVAAYVAQRSFEAIIPTLIADVSMYPEAKPETVIATDGGQRRSFEVILVTNGQATLSLAEGITPGFFGRLKPSQEQRQYEVSPNTLVILPTPHARRWENVNEGFSYRLARTPVGDMRKV